MRRRRQRRITGFLKACGCMLVLAIIVFGIRLLSDNVVVDDKTETETITEFEKEVILIILDSEFLQYKDSEYLLAQILHCETGGENSLEMCYVGSVVLNRIRTDYHDFANINTVEEVLYQGYGTPLQQYANETIQKVEGGILPSEKALQVAHGLIYGTIECLPECILFQTAFVPEGWNTEVVDLPGNEIHVYSKPKDF